jgi:hypothetical protein
MLLTGSCHCGTVKFSVESHTPYPYMHCHCSICRKTQGGGGYAINIMAEAATLKYNKNKWLKIYRAKLLRKRELSPARRHFCGRCGTALWVSDPRWPTWVYPFASALDTQLPKPPQIQHIMLNYAASWIDVPKGKGHQHFREYPRLSIADWHRKHGLAQ